MNSNSHFPPNDPLSGRHLAMCILVGLIFAFLAFAADTF